MVFLGLLGWDFHGFKGFFGWVFRVFGCVFQGFRVVFLGFLVWVFKVFRGFGALGVGLKGL